MKKENYVVEIKCEDDLTGMVYEDCVSIGFQPLTVLGDFLNVFSYEGNSIYPKENYFLKKDYRNNPFFLNREYLGNTRFRPPHCFYPLFNAVYELELILSSKRNINLLNFEILKQFLSLNFSYVIEFQDNNPMYDLKLGENASPFMYKSIDYIENHEIDALFAEKEKKPFRFLYTCHSVEDIAFSVLHYLTFFGYKFSKCNHCGLYYATTTFKSKYCQRDSPYKEYTHLVCEKAVRNIKQKLARRRVLVYKGFQQSPDFFENKEKFYGFLDQCDEYKEKINKESSVKNLEEYEAYLYAPQFKKGSYYL